jgi:hypothetical protein
VALAGDRSLLVVVRRLTDQPAPVHRCPAYGARRPLGERGDDASDPQRGGARRRHSAVFAPTGDRSVMLGEPSSEPQCHVTTDRIVH